MVFPELCVDTAVVVENQCIILLIGQFLFRHPEAFLHFCLKFRSLIRITVIRTHYKFTCRNTDKGDLHAIGNLYFLA